MIRTAAQFAAAGRPQEAIRLLRDAIAEQPDDPALLAQLSAVLVDAGDPRGAEAASRAALALDPQSAPGLSGLALALLRQGRSDEAAAVVRHSLALDAEDADAWGYYALAGANRRRPQEQAIARDAYRRAIELAPHRATFRQYAAVVEHAFGDRAAARAHVRAGLGLAPQSPRLLALNAAYAPVAEQPALLVDVLAADPSAAEPREILDAAVTWERRVALTPVALLPALIAICSLAAQALATDLVAAISIGVAVLLERRLRGRLAVLPDGYRAVRAARTRVAAIVQRSLIGLCGLLVVAGAVAAWSAPSAACMLFAACVLSGLGAVIATMPDDRRGLAEVRRRVGRVRGGTAWRFGGLRQELVLWSALGVAVAGLIGVSSARVVGAVSGAAAGSVATAVVAVVAVHVVESVDAGLNAPQRYARALANRYRLLAAGMLAFGLLVLGGGGFVLGGQPFTGPATSDDPPDPVSSLIGPSLIGPSSIPSISVPSFSVPLPTFTLTPSPTP